LPGDEDDSGQLPPPSGLRVVAGGGHVTLDWDPVPGAAGYLVYRAEAADGPFEPLDHGGGDVLAVPGGPYADTSGEPGRVRYYAVAAVTDGASAGLLSEPIAATPGAVSGPVAVEVGDGVLGELARPWEAMIGSEHLSYMLRRDTTGGQVIGTELREALRIAHDELGVQAVRAHGILCDDLGVYTEVDGRAVHDFSGIDRVYDALMELGLRPVVELSFMPRDLARDPGKTVFNWEAIVSPPRDWDRWADLVHDLAEHLVGRYGREEVVSRWAFEVWNEANLEVFWSGTAEEYYRLYDVSAAAIRAVDPRLRVGGPASAAAGWIGEFLDHVRDSGAPVDFFPLTCTAMCRWTCGRCWPITGGRRRRRGGRSGDRPRRTSTGSATPSSRRRSCSVAWPRRWAGSSRCRTGSPPTTSRSSARRRNCSTAGSGCCQWGTCASPGTGRWTGWRGWVGSGCRCG
jgi:xylan 1,4-beta-xylosidase